MVLAFHQIIVCVSKVTLMKIVNPLIVMGHCLILRQSVQQMVHVLHQINVFVNPDILEIIVNYLAVTTFYTIHQ